MPPEPARPDPVRLPQTPAEWEALYRAFLPRLYAYVAARVPAPQDAEDLTAVVFLKAVRNRDQFTGRHERSLAAWLFAIARHAVTDFYRRADPRGEPQALEDAALALPAAQPSPEAALLEAERHAELRRLIRALPARRREIVALRYFGGLRNQEIAAVLGLGERTVAAHLSRALRDLYAAYQQLEEESHASQ
jgi:RNA polymerase sigma factor (sigma-70 family)